MVRMWSFLFGMEADQCSGGHSGSSKCWTCNGADLLSGREEEGRNTTSKRMRQFAKHYLLHLPTTTSERNERFSPASSILLLSRRITTFLQFSPPSNTEFNKRFNQKTRHIKKLLSSLSSSPPPPPRTAHAPSRFFPG